MADPLTITAAAASLRAGSLTAVELLDQVTARIAATEPELHGYASLDLDRARADAMRADRSAPLGPLHGIPFGVKDVFVAEGTRTTCGSAALADHAPDRDADVVATLRAAGAVLVGKHVTHELTCGVDTPPTRNPFDPARYPGGSSVGSGVSVAVGSALFAIGTDSSGSVRNPASVTGIVGLKPTYGLLSTTGVVRAATAPSIDHVGILARTVADVALVFGVLAPSTAFSHLPEPPGPRLGVLEPDERQVVDPEVGTIMRSTLDRLADLGADLVPVRLPELRDAASVAATLFAVELAEGNRALPAERPADHHPAVRRLLRNGGAVPGSTYRAALRRRDEIRHTLLTTMTDRRLDALVSPTMPRPPPLLSELVPERFLPEAVAWMCPFNLSGQPAISVPGGTTASGLPVGVQIACRPGEDGTMLRIAELVADC